MADKSVWDKMFAEAEKVFRAHHEPINKEMDKKLIINICGGSSFADKKINPSIPYTTKEAQREVRDAYNAGAQLWHFHPKDPETGALFLPMDKRLKVHKEWCDAAFEVAPDIITNVGNIYVGPPKFVEGTALIDEESILAETRVAPCIEPLIKMGPKNRYVETAVLLHHTCAAGGSLLLGVNTKVSCISVCKYLQDRGITIDIAPFKHSDITDAKEWLLDSGICKRPVILSTLMGVHNSPIPASTEEAIMLLFDYYRMLPKGPKAKGVLWQSLVGGRYWLPVTAAAIFLGADVVRVGMEDAIYMYPHSDELVSSCGKVTEAVAGIARRLGRELATPSEARTMLNLPQILK